MARGLRQSAGGVIYHVLNRGNARRTIFRKDRDAAAFMRLLGEVKLAVPVRVLGYCLMGNHWHLVLWPRGEGDLSRFMHRLSVTHEGGRGSGVLLRGGRGSGGRKGVRGGRGSGVLLRHRKDS